MIGKILILVLGLILIVPFATAEEDKSRKKGKAGYKSDPSFGGPATPGEQLAEDDAIKQPAISFPFINRTLRPWFDWKRRLNEESGLEFGIAYTALYQAVNDAPDGANSEAGSGVLRLSGQWTLLNRGSKNSSRIVFSADHRYAYTNTAPGDLGFEVGYLGIPGALFSDINTVLGDLYWLQLFSDGTGGFIFGRYDPNDYFDVLGYANPWTTFQNLAILFNASIALPDWSTGFGIGQWITNQWYVRGAINDVNGVAAETELFEDIDERYTTVEVGWSPSRDKRLFNNAHVTVWHADEREKVGIEDAKGIAVGANWTIDETWMMFMKAGWSDGTAPLYSKSITLGVTHNLETRSDLTGAAINWGKPSGGNLDEQITAEVFYRFQLAQNLAVTPSIQLLINPALNTEEDQIWLGSLRVRSTF